jgi:hypothetical protein
VVTEAFKKVLKKSKAPPKNLNTDWGNEFYNENFKALMKKHGINHYSTFSGLKATIVERFNRTLKTLMYKHFTLKGNRKWTGILPQLLKQYNSSIHRTINARPIDVNAENENSIRQRLLQSDTFTKPKFKVGDKVRGSKIKSLFDKGYLQNWTNEIFTVTEVDRTFEPPMYSLKDETGESITGKFYKEELQLAETGDFHLVEKVLRKKKNKDGTMMYYVKWKGLDKKHNSWVSDLVNL